jgi:hypothetical protein
MKLNLLKHLSCALLLTVFGTVTAPAASLVYEGFDYAALSPLNGLNGGSGFGAAPWAADTGVLVQPPPGLSSLFGLSSTGLCIGGGFNAARPLASPLNQAEFWASFMIQANPGNDMVFLGFDMMPTSLPLISFGRILNNCFIRQGGSLPVQLSYPWVVGSTYLLVARFKQSGLFTLVDLWVNPPNFTIPPLLSLNVPAVAYTWVNLQVQPGFLADEVRVGTTPGDVAGVTLGGSVSGGNLTLTWSHGTLLQAPTLDGPWQTNSASSPYTTPINSPQQFYRVIVQ